MKSEIWATLIIDPNTFLNSKKEIKIYLKLS